MTSKERILAAWEGREPDHLPLTTWCFGFAAPPELRWSREGVPVRFWYSKRLEHIHTLPQQWELDDDFRRALAWRSLGIDDVLEVSVPWSVAPEVSWQDSRESDPDVLVREYSTPSGSLRHAVRRSGEQQGEGWVVQPEHVPLIEDFNVPRFVRAPVRSAEDIPRLAWLYRGPDRAARDWFAARMGQVGPFASREGFAVQAWTAFGMDAAVWFMGVENAVLLAMDDPPAFGRLMEVIAAADYARSELAAADPRVDLIVQRGWYSSTDFWSPALFDAHVLPYLQQLAAMVHAHGKKLAYVMTTGIQTLGERLADAGVDVLYFVDPLDPVEKDVSLEKVCALLGGRLTLVGGISSLTLASPRGGGVADAVRRAVEAFAGTKRFILHPVDGLFPDTPWQGVMELVQAWRRWL